MGAVVRISGIALLALGVMTSPALAEPKITEKVQHYLLSATTINGLKNEMATKGPRRYWARTNWVVKWSGGCKVEVNITYTLPKHANPKAMPADVRARFDRMMINLTAHERLHGQNGIMAGAEMVRSRCKNPRQIVKKYNKADRALDRRTRHGRRDGVVLN